MTAIARMTLLTLIVGLSACAVQQPVPTAPPQRTPPPSVPTVKPPVGGPSKPKPPSATPKPMPRTSASFAPPPGGASHWDPKLGVYVLEKLTNTFYRQRTYYRWDGGWSWSTSLKGPWQETDSSGVPGGLGRAFSN
ncbi:hypothetical protein [Pseudomonas sp. R5(2019)]|uniref:hypothetical protein n=1 Tax=Pseudomonas sp. R5(2019) TaxID=2697566 RepID=UPI0014126F70|nr:hypothetical protein [Pseudomonas sp. R5(2019)]NBA93884.1 hypothetical protein [Pseudomonas sp. R5(2019)]